MNFNFLKKLDVDTLSKIFEAQIEDLIERRNIRDPKLFRTCLEAECCLDASFYEDIPNFTIIASEAFKTYHKKRAAEKAENDEAENDEAENDEAENDEAENDEAEDAEDEDEEDDIPTF